MMIYKLIYILILIAFVTTSKALVTTSVALVTSTNKKHIYIYMVFHGMSFLAHFWFA